jgi:hypothetical protein
MIVKDDVKDDGQVSSLTVSLSRSLCCHILL